MIAATLLPQDAQLLDVARSAHAAGLKLIHNGRRVVVSPIVPPGWREVAIVIRPQKVAA